MDSNTKKCNVLLDAWISSHHHDVQGRQLGKREGKRFQVGYLQVGILDVDYSIFTMGKEFFDVSLSDVCNLAFIVTFLLSEKGI